MMHLYRPYPRKRSGFIRKIILAVLLFAATIIAALLFFAPDEPELTFLPMPPSAQEETPRTESMGPVSLPPRAAVLEEAASSATETEAALAVADSADGPEVPPEDEPEEEAELIRRIINSGDTASGILNEWLGMAEIQQLSELCRPVFDLRRLQVGNPYAATLLRGSLNRFEYEIDTEQKLVVTRDESGIFQAKLEEIVYELTVERIAATINASLFQAVDEAGETPTLAVALADIFAWEINFIREVQPGDSFTLLVEKRFREGEFKGYGRIRAASFINNGKEFAGFLFRTPEGRLEYFTSEGESVKRAFLKAPLSFTRISSNFTNARLHPIYRVWRAHPGIDYAAPSGTPIRAVGDGQVTFAGWGNGAGNYIAIRHGNGYETMYLHLSRFASGLKKGQNVEQGQIIGYVGSTGDSTGPHLDFRMKRNGNYVNPLNELTPRSDPVAEKDLPAFGQMVKALRGCLNGDENPSLITLYPVDQS